MAVRHFSGTGDPNGVVFGDPGDIYQDETGGANSTFWTKESGVSTSTGWVAVASGGGAVLTDMQSLVGDGTLGNELMVNPAQMTFPVNPATGFIRTIARDFIVNNNSIANGGLDVNGRLQNFGAGGGPAVVSLADGGLLMNGITAPNGDVSFECFTRFTRRMAIERLSAWTDFTSGGDTFDNVDLGWNFTRLVRVDASPTTTITGIANTDLAGANASGILLTLTCTAGTLIFAHENLGSLPTNRFSLPSSVSLAIGVGESVTYYFDDSVGVSRFRVWR